MSSPLSATALAVLHQLEDGHFHSGEALGKALAVSRAAINRNIARLREAGIVIDSLTGRGYRLARSQQLLDQTRLLEQLTQPVHYLLQVDSTNRYLLDRLGELQPGECCIAEMQTAGRGRRGRNWASPLASQVICSLYWPLASGMKAASGLSLVVGIALVETLAQFGIEGLGLKWPNDLLCHGNKLGGILIEMNGQVQGTCHLIIGFGINVALDKNQMTAVEQSWCDLCGSNIQIDRTALTIALIKGLTEALRRFESEGMKPFLPLWNRWDHYYQKSVRLLNGEKAYAGVVRGIDDNGALLLERDGVISAFHCGELSLRSNG